MSAVSPELFKKHARIDDFAEDDDYLEHLLEAAELAVVTATNREAAELVDAETGKLPAPLTQAVMMLAAHWYNQRESVSMGQMHEVPDSLQALVKPYRRLTSSRNRDAGGTDEIQA